MGVYDLDIAFEIIWRMQAKKEEELKNSVSKEQRAQLQQEIDTLWEEESGLYENNLQQPIINKAFRVYAPILKKEAL